MTYNVFGGTLSLNQSINQLFHCKQSTENVHLDIIYKNYGKRTVKYKASKTWNKLPSSLKELSSVKYFSNKLKHLLQLTSS